MTDVVVELSMSLDGFIAGPDDDEAHALGTRGGEHVFDWYFSGAESYPPGTMFKAEGANRAVVDEMYARYGAFVSGRRTYDLVGGWGGSHPVDGAALVILTSHPPRDPPIGKSPITFVTNGIESAVEQARAAAAGKDVGMIGASPAQQALQAGLVDELHIHVAPILLGDGVRLFDKLGERSIQLEPLSTSDGPHVAHLRYRVRR